MKRPTIPRDARILLTASFLSIFASGLLAPIYAVYVGRIGGDVLAAGTTAAAFSIVAGVLTITFGHSRFLLRHSRIVIVLGYGLVTTAQLFYLVIRTPLELFAVQAAMGVAVALLEPTWDAMYSKDLSHDDAGRQWSLWAGARDLAVGISALVGAALVAFASFEVLFLVMAAFNLIALRVAVRITRVESS